MQIKILNDEEFEALPYPEMSTSVGVADPRTKTAYVRRTHMPIIDAFTIAHELEHLEDGHEGVHADHYRNGVYYKGVGEIFTALGSAIPGPWQPIAIAGSAAQAGQARKKEMSRQSAMSEGFQGGGPMGSFQPQVSQPNVVQPGQLPGTAGSGTGPQGEGVVGKVRGFFQGRNPAGMM